MCVLIFSTNSVWNIFHSKNWASYDPICILVYAVHYPLFLLDFNGTSIWQTFHKPANIKFHENELSASRAVPRGQTWRSYESFSFRGAVKECHIRQRDVVPSAKESHISFLPALERKAQFYVFVYGAKTVVVTVWSLPTEAEWTPAGKYHNHQNPTVNSLMPQAHHIRTSPLYWYLPFRFSEQSSKIADCNSLARLTTHNVAYHMNRVWQFVQLQRKARTCTERNCGVTLNCLTTTER
jgi:hypothetical protein